MNTPLLTGPCWSSRCKRSMSWTKAPHWRASCSCGFSTRAASGDAAQLEARLEASRAD